jgi:cytochrome P450
MNPLWFISLLTYKEARMHRSNSRAYDDFMAGVTRELQTRPLDELPSDCIAGALMRATQPSGKPLSFPQLKSNVAIMLAAGKFMFVGVGHVAAFFADARSAVALSSGFETSASAINSTVLSLIQHPAELARLEEELDASGLLKTPKRPEPR